MTRRYYTLPKLCECHQVGPSTIHKAILKAGVAPALMLNDCPYYDDAGSAAIAGQLLRDGKLPPLPRTRAAQEESD